MPYDLNQRLVIGVSSSAVFDLSESDTVFRGQGEEQYRKYQEDNLHNPLPKGMSFSFVRRLLSLNDLSSDPVGNPIVEVVLKTQTSQCSKQNAVLMRGTQRDCENRSHSHAPPDTADGLNWLPSGQCVIARPTVPIMLKATRARTAMHLVHRIGKFSIGQRGEWVCLDSIEA